MGIKILLFLKISFQSYMLMEYKEHLIFSLWSGSAIKLQQANNPQK